MTCPSCQTPIPDASRFCPGCGAPASKGALSDVSASMTFPMRLLPGSALVGTALLLVSSDPAAQVNTEVLRKRIKQKGISFVLEGAHPHDVGEILGREGVCVRAGHHCTQPLMRRLGVTATNRASWAVHNTPADTDRLIEALGTVARVLQL